MPKVQDTTDHCRKMLLKPQDMLVITIIISRSVVSVNNSQLKSNSHLVNSSG